MFPPSLVQPFSTPDDFGKFFIQKLDNIHKSLNALTEPSPSTEVNVSLDTNICMNTSFTDLDPISRRGPKNDCKNG
jgi:hypothetical protein